MYGAYRLNSANHLLTLFTATYAKRLLRLSPKLRSISLRYFSCGRVIYPPYPGKTAGIDDYVEIQVGGGKISGEKDRGTNKYCNTYQRKVLRPELSQNVLKLTCKSSAAGGICDVYLVGTCHVSQESCQEVQAVIKYLKPEVVFLELCPNRKAVLTRQTLKVPTLGEILSMLMKSPNRFAILYGWFTAKANPLGVVPGAEFRVAYEEAMKYGGTVVLGDRSLHITSRRTWAKLPLWHMIKLLYLPFQPAFWDRLQVLLPTNADLFKMFKEGDIDRLTPLVVKMLKDMNVDTLDLVIQEMSKHVPTVVETLIHERDQYMSAILLEVAREHNSVVAVVGGAHLAGIRKNWKQPVEMERLLRMPSGRDIIGMSKIVSCIGATVAGVAIISGIYLSIKKWV